MAAMAVLDMCELIGKLMEIAFQTGRIQTDMNAQSCFGQTSHQKSPNKKWARKQKGSSQAEKLPGTPKNSGFKPQLE